MFKLVNNILLLIGDTETLKVLLPSIFTSVCTMINSIITILVAIAGFSVNSMLNRRSLTNEIIKHKSNKQLDKLQEIPIELLNCINMLTDKDLILFKNPSKNDASVFSDNIRNMINTLAAYGSKDAIKLTGHLNQALYKIRSKFSENKTKLVPLEYRVELIVYLTLLLCQLKLDLTNTLMEPNLYYRCRINEDSLKFNDFNAKMIELNNNIVKDLKLNKAFKIRCNNKNLVPKNIPDKSSETSV